MSDNMDAFNVTQDNLYYHATKSYFSQLKIGKPGVNSVFGVHIPVERHAIFLTKNKAFAEAFHPNGRVLEVIVNVGDTLDLDSEFGRRIVDQFIDYLADNPEQRDEWLAVKDKHFDTWQLLDGDLGKAFSLYLRDNRLADSVSFTEDTANPDYGEPHIEGKTLVVLDENDVVLLDTLKQQRAQSRPLAASDTVPAP